MQQNDILVVDRSKLFREGMKRLLAERSFHVCGEASCIEEAISQIETGARPRVVLLDFPGDGADGIDHLQRLRRGGEELKLVVLTNELNFDRLTASLSVGADGYLLKDMSPDALVQSLRLILLGEKVLPTTLALLLVSRRFRVENQIKAIQPSQKLSHREVQILRCLMQGDSNKLIANQLNITEGTVKVHLKGVLKKINARNRTQAAIWASNGGLTSGISEEMARQGHILDAKPHGNGSHGVA
jgi:two-component system nitrate/nitrite response regulator NarL